jgi:hypothetical protein
MGGDVAVRLGGERGIVGVSDGVEVARRESAALERPACRLLRQLPGRERYGELAVLSARETLFFGGRDDDSVDDERRGRIVENSVNPEYAQK